MKSSLVNFKTISLAKVFAEIHIRKVSGLLKIRNIHKEHQAIALILCRINNDDKINSIFKKNSFRP